MAKRYESEAHVIFDGREAPVYARFDVYTDGGLKQWHGSLGTDDPGLCFKVVDSDRVHLRMPDGKEAVIIPATRDGEKGSISFTGSGPAPV